MSGGDIFRSSTLTRKLSLWNSHQPFTLGHLILENSGLILHSGSLWFLEDPRVPLSFSGEPLWPGELPRSPSRDGTEGWFWDHPWALLVTSPLQFQGKWYIIAKADSRIHNGNQENLTMPSITYWLMEDRSLVGNTTMPR